MSRVTLDGVALQVNTNGVKPGQLTAVDDSKSWLSRAQIAEARFGDDALTFEVVALTGKRHRVSYVAGAPAIPVNNVAALDQLYTKYLQTTYDITGEGLAKAQAQYFYGLYSATQLLWAQRAKLLAQLNDPDIPTSTKNTIIGSVASTYSAILARALPLVLYGTTIQVLFAEGSSCQFTDWVISDHTDFQFNLISRVSV